MLYAIHGQHEPSVTFLPAESPLQMPEQSLDRKPERSFAPETAPRAVGLRRFVVILATIALTAVAANEMFNVLKVAGLTAIEALLLALFVVLFAWVAFSFVSCAIGFGLTLARREHRLSIVPPAPPARIETRNALLLPTYNEDPRRVMARLGAIFESIRETGHIGQFEFFVLSDSTDPAVWIREEAEFMAMRKRLATDAIYYRHRSKNVARKAGNIAEWITRFGGRYDHMIVLDADSLMTGDTVVRLVAAMETHPKVGLIQTVPRLLNGRTLFARLQQFANRLYGPVLATGIAWWHGSESNYWGHNAIIRVRAFAESAGLPELKGEPPLGGHVLSHDFVEAALMRRAGWTIHLAPELEGTYEEGPPSMTDYAVRDRRWCQGNLQHAKVLPARGLHWVSRLHLLVGIGSYITAPLWLLFLLVGILSSLQAQFIRPDYFPAGVSLFPQWPAQDPVRAAWVFAGTMSLLIVPKLLGYLATVVRGTTRRQFGGGTRLFGGTIAEIVLSALVAPVMMFMQSKAVAEILMGRDSGWRTQRREGSGPSRSELMAYYAAPTTLGVVLAVAAFLVSLPLLAWMSPVLVGLLLAVPLASTTSTAPLRPVARPGAMLLTPEEIHPPAVLMTANRFVARAHAEDADVPLSAFEQLARNPELLTLHRRMLPETRARARGEVDVDLLVALAKLEDVQGWREAETLLSPSERMAALRSRAALDRLFPAGHAGECGSASSQMPPSGSGI